MVTQKDLIILKVIEILKNNPEGIRYSQLINMVKESLPDIPFINTIRGVVWDIDIQKPNEIYKPERGLFRHVSFRGKEEIIETKKPLERKTLKEQDFYESFANYLVELGDCTKAIPLGGNKFKDKWGTPDVIGVYKSNKLAIIQCETEIISAEIKIDDLGLINAFGQACAYKAFSHKVYIVIPKSASEEDRSRIDSLCLIFGIGLILFDSNNIENPSFEIKTRPTKHEPDSFYVNNYLKLMEKKDLDYLGLL